MIATASGKLVMRGSTLVCTAVSHEMASEIAFALNYLESARAEAAKRAEFYRSNPE